MKKRLHILWFFTWTLVIGFVGSIVWLLIWLFTGWDYLDWIMSLARKKRFFD